MNRCLWSLWALWMAWAGGVEAASAAEGNAPATPRRARVVIVQRAGAIVRFAPQPEVIQQLVEDGLRRLTGAAGGPAAWRGMLTTQDVVGLKVFARPGPTSGTRPTVAAAVVRSLLEFGLRPHQILVWDRHLADLRLSGFFDLADQFGVRVAGSAEAGYEEGRFYENFLLGQLSWGDLEFGREGQGVGRRSHGSKLLGPEVTRFISIAPLLNHNLVGVSGHCWGLAMGSTDNVARFEHSASRLADAVPELLANESLALGDRFALGITDALIGQYQGEERQLLHYTATLDQLWFSTDPVALDVLGLLELDRLRRQVELSAPRAPLDLYENAALLELGVSRTNLIEVVRGVN